MTTTMLPGLGSLPLAGLSSAPVGTASRRPLLLRFLDAVKESNQRRAEREIAAYIQRHGGALSDRVERGIERSLL